MGLRRRRRRPIRRRRRRRPNRNQSRPSKNSIDGWRGKSEAGKEIESEATQQSYSDRYGAVTSPPPSDLYVVFVIIISPLFVPIRLCFVWILIVYFEVAHCVPALMMEMQQSQQEGEPLFEEKTRD
ncbi:hypothetical protein FH972_004748 [Carpinus fangiana]|uniref:Uncharacterized protein n=1 Tax=Carpinus fangiana TaxID=176857 RepID=A0A5N6QMH0_9ROSI|nr:hypothetical protein FH972_004748 [Carpinus fangiana]